MKTIRIRRKPGRVVARHHVREKLEAMILSGATRPGEKIVQQEIAGRLGVSQSVVREALLELRGYGLIETIDNRGMFVGNIDPQTLVESYEIREMHEALAARLCCERITREEVAQIRVTAERACEAGLAGDLDEMGRLDRALHDSLLQISRNRMLQRLAQHHILLGKVVRVNSSPRVVLADHMAILDAIEAGKADLAERLIRKHIRIGRDTIVKEIASGRFTPHWVV